MGECALYLCLSPRVYVCIFRRFEPYVGACTCMRVHIFPSPAGHSVPLGSSGRSGRDPCSSLLPPPALLCPGFLFWDQARKSYRGSCFWGPISCIVTQRLLIARPGYPMSQARDCPPLRTPCLTPPPSLPNSKMVKDELKLKTGNGSNSSIWASQSVGVTLGTTVFEAGP